MTEGNISGSYKSLEAMRYAIQKHLDEDVLKIPMMPQVASRVMSLISNPNVDLSDVSELIHRDASLAARVLQVANSAVYRGSQTIGSLGEAINRMGTRTLSEITLSASLRAGIFRVPGYEKEVHQLWRHSLASGFFNKGIARITRSQEDTLFFCGLLHAIGKPAVLQVISDLNQQHRFLLKPEVLEAVLEEFHGLIGTTMAEQWNLPKPVQIACAYYRDYAQAPECQRDAAMTYLADRLATSIVRPDLVDPERLKEDSVFASLQLGPDEVNRVLALKDSVLNYVDATDH